MVGNFPRIHAAAVERSPFQGGGMGGESRVPLQQGDAIGYLVEHIVDVYKRQALFEKTFHVDLGNVYHAFGRLRGQQNPTAFLDEMKEKLLKKMRDMDRICYITKKRGKNTSFL